MEIKVLKNILSANDAIAQRNRQQFDEHGTFVIDIMSSPGAGKTSVILRTIAGLSPRTRIAVIEGDVASSVDAEKVIKAGVPAIQINTNGGCHLDANMIENALHDLPLANIDLLLIENVGNLICPAEFALGEHSRVMLLSMPEGDDKPLKYPTMFADVDVVLLNKTDLQPYVDFDTEAFCRIVTGLNPDVKIFPVSCKTGEGLEAWSSWLEERLREMKGRVRK